MRESRFADQLISEMINRLEQGEDAGELSSHMGISRQTLYTWRRRYGGMNPAQIQQQRRLQRQNYGLRRSNANLSHENRLLKETLNATDLTPARKRKLVGHLIKEHGASERQSCRLLGMHRSTRRYAQSKKPRSS